MNICLVSQNYPPETAQGGIGTQTRNKACALARLGHTVHVLSSAAGPAAEMTTRIDGGVVVHRIRRPGEDPGLEFGVYHPHTYWLGYTWSVLRALRHLTETTPFDVIDFAEYGAEGFSYQLDRNPQDHIPVVVQLHGPLAMLATHINWPDKDSDFYRVGTFMEGVSIRLANRLMACSAGIADFTAESYGILRDEIEVVHCGVDTDVFRPAPGAEDHRTRPTILFVGNLAASKGAGTAVEAVLRLRSRYPDIKLQIIGRGDGKFVAELQSRVEADDATSNVDFLGFVDHERLPAFYQRADVFCSPATYEGGTANVYLEAMACGCPVVASTAGGAVEAVVDGTTGCLVPPDDVGLVADALDLILGDELLRHRMKENCRTRAERHFSMDRYISRILGVYQAAIDRGERLGSPRAAPVGGQV